MANLSNINNILRTSSLGVGINCDAEFSLDIEKASANAILSLNSNGGSGAEYLLSSTTSGELVLNKRYVGDRLTISSGGDATFAGNVTTTAGRLQLGAVALPSAGVAAITNRSSDNSLYIQTSSGNTAYLLDGSQNTMYSAASTAHNFYISNVPKLTIDSNGDSTFAGTGTFTSASSYVLTAKSTDTDAADIFRVVADDDGLVASVSKDASDNGELYVWSGTQAANIQLYGGTGNATFAGTVDGQGFRTTSGSTDYSLLTRNSSNTAVYIQQAGSGNIVDFRYSSQAAGQGTSAMVIDSSGNVGIGITPNVNSSVVNVIQLGKGMTLLGNANDDRATMAANLYLDTGTAFRYVMDGLAGRFSIEDGNMVWGTASSGTAGTVATADTKMTLLNNGNLGIGTTSPAEKLHVSGGNIRLDSTIAGNNGILMIYDSNTTQSGQIYGSSGDLKIYSPADVLFNQGGNVGIGTTSPSSKLSISGGQAAIDLTRGTLGDSKWGFSSDSTALYIAELSTGTTDHIMTLKETTGNVGIGTTNPVSAKLVSSYDGTVNNGMAIINTNTGTLVQNLIIFKRNTTEVGSITSNNTTTTYVTSSDYRLKENVVEMTGALKRVSQLKPSRFNFIADADKTVDGFLAHEVQDIVPEAITGEKDGVDEKGNPKYQGIDQSKLVPLLVGAIKELKAEIEILKNK